LTNDAACNLAKLVDLAVLDKLEILYLGRMLHSLQASVSRSRAKILIMVNVFVRVDKVIIGLMFWNFIGMLLNVFLGYLELVVENNAI